ncbi:hypothetical protein [Novosphingobium rosa]|uniref:hypothetical protein n=1 Tax=Novosphingobium rosa TaxID=76978 RepID=UPI00082F6F74|nr:hypothetical protein [Novosphingobium rosa]
MPRQIDPTEEDNSEQRDEGQAQDVAQDALERQTGLYEDSGKGDENDPTEILPDDVPDLIDTMNQMISSGQIDNGAYAGEPVHDDEEGFLGNTDSDEDDE